MAFANTNGFLTGSQPIPTPAGSDIIAYRAAIALTTNDLDANDAGSVCILPAGCVPTGITYDSDDLDTNGTPTLLASVGFMNAGDTDLDGTALVAGITASQTGTAVQLVSTALMRVAPSQSDRRIGIKFTAGAATKAAGFVGITLFYRAA